MIAEAAEHLAPGGKPGREQKKMKSFEELARMPLESLLYYVLAGEGSKKAEAVAD